MNKLVYVLILLILAIGIVFLLPLGSAEVETKHYEKGEVSFDYPANWQELKPQTSQLAAFKDPATGYKITINRQMVPSGYKSNENFVINPPSGVQNDFKPVTQQNSEISGVKSYENTYNTKLNGTSITQKELWLEKNNAYYSVIYQSQPSSSISFPFGSKKSGFDVIKKSLKINNSKPNKTAVFGSVYIPDLNVKWDVRTDTVNAINGVYHYKESFYAGQNGSYGLLGHHTTYSAPFNHLENLQKGDKVVVNDYLTQKKYTYDVVSNNDIRYDYTTNKITFHEGSKELILATCWPPGSTAAEIYIHCQLSSIEPLN